MKSTTILWIAIAVVVIGGIAWYVSPYGPAAPSTMSPYTPELPTVPAPAAPGQPAATNTPSAVTVAFTDNGFSPASVTVPVGTKVTFENRSSEAMWVASNPHPSHTGYDGTSRDTHCAAGYSGAASFDECAMGETGATYSFTFTKSGTWGYHNHADHAMTGTVIVR